MLPNRRTVSMDDIDFPILRATVTLPTGHVATNTSSSRAPEITLLENFNGILSNGEEECHYTSGLVILRNGFGIQKRALKGIERKLRMVEMFVTRRGHMPPSKCVSKPI